MTLVAKPFANLVTFSRGTGATRVNSAGLIVGVDFSATSNTITTGSKTFTLTADANVNRDWAVNSSVIAVAQAGATGSMTGTVTSYTPSTQSLVINVTSVTGSGTSTDWRIGSLEMREDYDPVTLVRKGVLSEVGATNLANSSNANTTGGTAPTITLFPNFNSGVGVDSGPLGLPFVRLNVGATTPAYFGVRSTGGPTLVPTFTTSLSLSFWGRVQEGTVGFGPTMNDDQPVSFTGDGILTTQWKFFSYVFGAGSSGKEVRFVRVPTANTIYEFAGMQVVTEQSAVTSRIPTTTAQVTRNADNFPLTAAALTSIRQGEGTLYAEIDCPDTGVAQKRALRLSGTNADIRIGKQGTGTLSNFSKMAEGAGLRLMGTANSLIRGNGQELLPVTAINDRNGVAVAFPVANGVAFDGSNRFGLLSAGEEVYIDGLLGTFSGKGAAAISLGVHYNGNRFLMSSSNAGVVLVSDGTSYRRVNTPVITQPTNEITSGLVGGTLRNVIVGNAGFIATSDDNGETWTARASGIVNNLGAVAFGTSRFLATRPNNTNSLLSSPDGITWTAIGAGLPATQTEDLHFANNVWVILGTNGSISTSTDGVNFTAATNTNTTQKLNGVTYSPTLNLWVAVGNGGTIITATDPAGTWTVQTSGTTQPLQEAAIFNNAIYVVGSTQTLLTSTNGTTYTSLTAGVTANLAGIAASPTTLLITGANGAMASSTDGTTFTSRTNNNAALNGIAFGNNTFVSVGNSANGSGYIATIGADGTVTRRVSGTTASMSNVRFLDDQFYALNQNINFRRSTNGETWTEIPGSADASYIHEDIARNGNVFIVALSTAAGTIRAIRRSTDNGGSWQTITITGVTPSGAGQLRGVNFANNIFVLVGQAGTIVTLDASGANHVLRTSGTTQNLNSVMYSTRDNLWYAAGNGGVLLYSPDAITWTAVQNSGTASILGTTLQSNQPLPQFKSGVNKIALSYKQNQVIAALNGVSSTSDTAATIPTITAASIAENLNGYIGKVEIFPTALTTAEMTAKTL